jgi:RNA polymerase sigma factor (sigma-70 family)
VKLEALAEQITKDYLPQILGWAVKKTGSGDGGEELAQEVFLQFLHAVKNAQRIEKLENLLWKVAHYCWCNYLKKSVKRKVLTELNENLPLQTDFADDIISAQIRSKQLSKMRKEISNLSRLQREVMILHYLDGLPASEIAQRLNTTQNAVTWHLFDARKKVRREIEKMDEKIEYVYRPGKLAVGSSGDEGPDPDTKWLRASLIRQNLCLLCYREGKNIDELATLTGIPKPYLEFDLDWLTEREFMTMEGRKYLTAFPIVSRRHFQDVATMYNDTRGVLIDKVIDYLFTRENEIRSVGFYGSHFPPEKLMWAVITMFISFVSRNSPLLLRLKNRSHYPIRPDGGKYVVIASDMSEVQELNPDGYNGEILWGGFSGIWSDSCVLGSDTDMYYWLGVNKFKDAKYRPEIVGAPKTRGSLLHRVYSSVIEPGFSENILEPHGKEALAQAIEGGLILKESGGYKPQFVIFTKEQLEKLQEEIYRPLAQMIEGNLTELGKKKSAMHKAEFPKINKPYADYHTYLDLWDFGIYTLMYAAKGGKIKMPETPETDALLTLTIIK